MAAVDTWLCVVLEGGDAIRCDASAASSIDAWVGDYLTSAKTRDRVLELPTITGATYHIAASEVRGWFVSTPETRLAEAEQDKWDRDEIAAHRAAVGDFDGDEVYD